MMKPPKMTDATKSNSGNEAIQTLLDKQSIGEVLLTYTHAIDRSDEATLRSVFHPDSEHNHGFVGPSSLPDAPSSADKPADFVSFALGYLKGFSSSHHQLGGPLITVTGNTAKSEVYFTATQVMRAKGDPLAAEGALEHEVEISSGGRYIDELEKRNGEWKIRRRTGEMDWTRALPRDS